MLSLVFKIIPLASILFTFANNLSYTVFLTTSLLTKLLNLLQSTGTVFNFSTSILSISAFKIAKSNFAASLDVSTPVVFFKSTLLHKWANLIQLPFDK